MLPTDKVCGAIPVYPTHLCKFAKWCSDHPAMVVSTRPLPDLDSSLGPLLQALALSSPKMEQELLSVSACIDFSTEPAFLAVREVWEKPVKMLYLPQHTMETAGLLRRSMQHMTTGMVQTCQIILEKTELLNEKQLRSRQRANLERVLAW